MSESENNRVRVFVTHKTTHQFEAQSIIAALEPYGADRLQFFLAEKDIPPGAALRQYIKERLRQTDILLFIVPKTDVDWTWPIFEAGLFEGSPKDSQNFSRIILLYSPAVEIPKPLEELKAVKAVERDVIDFLRKFFGTTEITGIEPPLNSSFANNDQLVQQTASNICKLFSDEKANIISCLPHIAIHIEKPSEISAESIPENSIIYAEEEALRIFELNAIPRPGNPFLTWGEFIQHLDSNHDNWLQSLINMIDTYNRGRIPREFRITLRTEEDKIYLSSLHKIDSLGDGGRRFHIIFTPQVSEGLFVNVPDKFSTLLTCLILGSRLEWEVCEKFFTSLKYWPIEQKKREKIFVQIREAIANIEGEARYRQNELSQQVNDDRLLAVFSNSSDIRKKLEDNLTEQQKLKQCLSTLSNDTSEKKIRSALENLYNLNRQVMQIVSNEYNNMITVEN